VTAIPSAKTSDYGGQGEFSMDFSLIWSFDPRKWCVIFIGTVLFPGSMRVADSGIKTANKWTVLMNRKANRIVKSVIRDLEGVRQ
jgi:hypothetical protein